MVQSKKKWILLGFLGFTVGLGIGVGRVVVHQALKLQRVFLKNGLSSFSDLKKKNDSKDQKVEVQDEQLTLFLETLKIIQENYYYDIPNWPLDAINGILKHDPYSEFLSKEEWKDLHTQTHGAFGGIGIEIRPTGDCLTIETVLEDTPAWRARLQNRDRILKIDDQFVKSLLLNDAVSKIHGEPGTEVKLLILRGKEEIEFRIKREIIKINPVKATVLGEGFGYVRLSTFNENAAYELAKAVERILKQKPKAIVFDLRSNPGGRLDQAIEVASLFIEKGKPIVSIRNKDASTEVYFSKDFSKDKSKSHLKKFPHFEMAILVDIGTASAAEIVAGALQEHGLALVVGQPTVGKSSVQALIERHQGGLKLTIGSYYTPMGRNIHEEGIEPDVPVDLLDFELLKKARERGKMVLDFVQAQKKKSTVYSKAKVQSKKQVQHDPVFFFKDPEEDYHLQSALNCLRARLKNPKQ